MFFLNKKKLSEKDIDSNLKKKVFSILIETLENVAKYSPGREEEEKFGMPVAMLRLIGQYYYVTTGNLILKDKAEALKEKLDTINSCDRESLKDLFREAIMKQNLESDSTGNLGLIEMARKSGNKLEYLFEEVNDTYLYYTLTIKMEERPD